MQGARRSGRAEFDYRPAAFVEDRQRTDSSYNALEVVAGAFLEGKFHFRARWALGNRGRELVAVLGVREKPWTPTLERDGLTVVKLPHRGHRLMRSVRPR